MNMLQKFIPQNVEKTFYNTENCGNIISQYT